MIRAFSWVRPAQEALDEYKESIKCQLQNDSITFRIAYSRDRQQTIIINAEYGPALEQSIKVLNKNLKESSELVIFAGRIYKCTINDSNRRYNQLKLAFILDLPDWYAAERFDAILLWISPSGTQNINFNQHNLPSRNVLVYLG